jgi:hypothetical protein
VREQKQVMQETLSTKRQALLGPVVVSRQNKKLERFLHDQGLKINPAFAIREDAPAADPSRLVKGSQFPTGNSAIEFGLWAASCPEIADLEGAHSLLSYRKWDDTYKLRPVVEGRRKFVPEAAAGPRLSDKITRHGKVAVDDSARFLASQSGKGFNTMMTFTLDKMARHRIAPRAVLGDFCDLETGECIEFRGRYCPLVIVPARVVSCGEQAGPIGYSLLEIEPMRVELTPELEGTHILKPATTIQAEFSRCIDGMQKMYQRGFSYQGGRVFGSYAGFRALGTVRCGLAVLPASARRGARSPWPMRKTFTWAGMCQGDLFTAAKVPAELRPLVEPGCEFTLLEAIDPQPLRYAWVVENPRYGDFCDIATREMFPGESNPHIHALFDWQVPRAAFDAWASRIEGIWGQGWAHIERLRDSAAAGAYVLKAAGYMTKGEGDNGQGWVFGNRYWVSNGKRDIPGSGARAPGFTGVAVLPHGQLDLLCAHAAEHQRERLDGLRRRRDTAAAAIKQARTPQAKSKLTGVLKALRKRIDGRAIIAGKWQMLFRGAAALGEFFGWAASRQDQETSELLPAKPAGFWWTHSKAASPTEDRGNWREHMSKRGLRALLKMPVLNWHDVENQREWYDRFEPAWPDFS